MDPLRSPHLSGRSRYDNHAPPSHQFVDPNYYPRQTHHAASFLPPLPPPPPYQNQNPPRRHERDFRAPVEDGGHLFLPYPHPHDPFLQPSPRITDRLPLPEDRYPSCRPHLLGPGEGFVQDPRECTVLDANKFRVVDESQDLIRLRWEEDDRRRLASSCRGNFYPEDLDGGSVGRKRMRWAQDPDHEENSGGRSQRHVQLWNGEVGHQHRAFPESLPGASLGAAYTSSPRGTRHFVATDGNREAASVTEWRQQQLPLMRSYSDRGREDRREVASIMERHLQPPLPSMQPSAHSYSDGDREFLENNNADVAYEAPIAGAVYGSQENYFRGNRGKRKMCGANDYSISHSPIKQPTKRPSALSRIQSGISVWNRIQEKPSFLSSPSPAPFSPSSNAVQHQAEMGVPDFSFKLNNLAGQILASPSLAVSFDGTDPEESMPKKTVKKKKLVRKWEEFAVPTDPGSSVSAVKDGIPQEPISDTPRKVLNDLKLSGKQGASSIKPANDANSQTCSTKVLGTGKKTPNCIAIGEVNDSNCHSAEIAEFRLANSTNSTNSEHCQADTNATEKRISENLSISVSVFKAGGDDTDKEKKFINLGENDGQNCTSPPVDIGAVNDASSRPFDQGAPEAAPESGTEQLPSAIFLDENIISDNHDNQDIDGPDDDEKYGCPDNGFVPSSSEHSSSSPLGSDEQFVMPVDHISSTFSKDDSIEKNLKSKKKTDEDQLTEVNKGAKEEFKDFGYGEITNADAYLHSEMQNVSADLPPLLIDAVAGEYHPETAIFEKDDGCSIHAHVEIPQSDCLRPGGKSLAICSFIMSETQDASHFAVPEQLHPGLPDSYGCANFNNCCDKQDQKLSKEDNCSLPVKGSLVSEAEGVKSDEDINCKPILGKQKNLLSHDSEKQKITESKPVNGQVHLGQKTFLSSGVPKVVPSRANLVTSLKESAHSRHNLRNKTWRRNDASSSSSQVVLQSQRVGSLCKQSPKKPGKLQSSYVRKGNSLIRKPSIEFPPQPSHTLGISSKLSKDNMEKSMNFESKDTTNDGFTCSNTSFERPKTPPLPLGTKLSNSTADPLLEAPHPLSENSIREVRTEVHSRPLDLASCSVDDQNVKIDETSDPLCTKSMVYLKHKSNQLVAASGPKPTDSANPSLDKAQTFPSSASSDLYYRKKKNQLVRTIYSSDGQNKQDMVHAENTSSDEKKVPIFTSNRSSSSLLKKKLNKVREKQLKHFSFSRVWTLNGLEPHKKGASPLTRLKVLPHLFPWKRTTYWTNNSSVLKRRSLLLRSQKMLLTRDIAYTLSTDGYSLQKSGVSQVGRCSLKWSRSMQRRSKVVNKEAALAVAEVERKKKEREKLASVSDHKNEHLCAIDQGVRNSRKISLSQRKLLGGNNEYIRIGNGNQLVRDPKKLIRILASEKVRWSLHTARLRLAKKRQYCQFFTRFGECNKKGGKCPYIHDPTKVAICTKYLSGSCSNTNCKLTHKIIPERMPDCSYFLQGLCTNTSCPYRHVNVNPNASVCEGFLKGYCVEGDECHKKHSYVCPLYKATGKCLQGSKCKLHHPKIKNKCKAKKGSTVQSNSWGRYFGSSISDVGKSLAVSLDNEDDKKVEDLFCFGGRFADYISLSLDNHDGESSFVASKDLHQSEFSSGNSLMQKDNLDALIKPIRIMRKDYSMPLSADSSYNYNNHNGYGCSCG
ncbi:uncharacterized protein LOC135622303 [Musa acuminata AAA Group]|uniref:uncharacterized protein LOC135622303 n=1 Tax=Musa acuminata AAA Group TaxID=214697 RepID=UPI0031E2B36C